ncbi:MAG: arginine--tRNA ligase [Thiotrichaceae bacterium]|nr:arginine--tRNA ligase [Thiotrichaceae bacterium]
MKPQLQTLFQHALVQLQTEGLIPQDTVVEVQLEHSRDPKFGDFACNLAMVLAKIAKMRPRDLAERIVAALPSADFVSKVEIAGAGFINIFLVPNAYRQVIATVLQQGEHYGRGQVGAGQKVMVEFVSANPTGPLHVGHGRGAAYGAALSNLLSVAGYDVYKEYYVNDAGRQMDILATSVWLRYLESYGEPFTFPSNAYKGVYIRDISAALKQQYGDSLHHPISAVFADLPADEPQGGDKEIYIDAMIARCKQLLGATGYEQVFQAGLVDILGDIRQDLEEFSVTYDNWFSERSLSDNHTVERAIEKLKAQGHTYEQNGALWFRSSSFGDEKDRVLVRENGLMTYFASDIAYHLNKIERGFDVLINIWGADHHGYIPRVKAAMSALGANPECLTVLLVQFATLYRGTERLQMSTRSGEFVTLRELRDDVGNDAARFFYVQRKSEQHLDFDLDLAKSQSSDNPVYYVQYAHARIASVLRELTERGFPAHEFNAADLASLDSPHEQTLLTRLARYPEVIEAAARAYEPHQIAYYLRELAQDFHTYYNAYKFLIDDANLRNARLSLSKAVQQVLRNGLNIIGVSAPDVM